MSSIAAQRMYAMKDYLKTTSKAMGPITNGLDPHESKKKYFFFVILSYQLFVMVMETTNSVIRSLLIPMYSWKWHLNSSKV